jgi:hypothetical protein
MEPPRADVHTTVATVVCADIDVKDFSWDRGPLLFSTTSSGPCEPISRIYRFELSRRTHGSAAAQQSNCQEMPTG